MALFGMEIKSRRKVNVEGFNPQYLNDRTAIRQRKQMNFLRSVFSVASLLLGGTMLYVSLHYVPAFVSPKKVLKFATGDSAALNTYDFDRKSPVHKFFGPVTQFFQLDRSYMKPGQSIEVKYDLPPGAYVNLDILQCQRMWVFEILDCAVVGKFSARTKQRAGVESFTLEDGGFYHFRHEVVNVAAGEPYRISWERGQ